MGAFKLTKLEKERAKKFDTDHIDFCWSKGAGTIGGGILYEFMPTSLGNILIVRCMKCRESANITDFDQF